MCDDDETRVLPGVADFDSHATYSIAHASSSAAARLSCAYTGNSAHSAIYTVSAPVPPLLTIEALLDYSEAAQKVKGRIFVATAVPLHLASTKTIL